ncbi:transcriptional regulator [Bacillus pseudomycoides]|nr:transcriptional regulator [Bacillus pseudomycoides]
MYENIKAKARLASLLQERGLSEEEFALKAGVRLTTIQRFDRTARHDLTRLVQIARALEIQIEDLVVVETEAEVR